MKLMKPVKLISALMLAVALCACGNSKQAGEAGENVKPALMWFDAEANFARFQQQDSIDYYLQKIKSLGFTHAIVDVRPITGEVLYGSEYAPRMEEWNGARRGDFDYLGYFIEEGHKLGLEIHASLNVFCAGHNYFDRGVVYSQHPEWSSMVYDPEKGIVPITEMKQDYGAMVNPVNDEYRTYILNILTELVKKYPALDGVMLDRVRYDGIRADFSDLSRQKFEEYIGSKVEKFPEDILTWEKGDAGRYVGHLDLQGVGPVGRSCNLPVVVVGDGLRSVTEVPDELVVPGCGGYVDGGDDLRTGFEDVVHLDVRGESAIGVVAVEVLEEDLGEEVGHLLGLDGDAALPVLEHGGLGPVDR